MAEEIACAEPVGVCQMYHRILAVAVVLLASGAAAVGISGYEEREFPACESVESIGVAHMSPDGVITLHIRSLPPGPIAEGELRYAPGDAHYAEIARHLGDISPGASTPVRPWC
jgi:hypothetical protein